MAEVGVDDIMAVLREASARLASASEHLGQLDGEIGDGDHGTTMVRGFSAIVRALGEVEPGSSDLTTLFALCAGSFLDSVGATAGPLYASGLLRAGSYAEGRESLPAQEAPMLLVALGDGIGSRGKAVAGDKTMMDVWLPVGQAVKAARAKGAPLGDTLAEVKTVAGHATEATRSMIASKGRAARLGERSIGHVDPGAASAAIIIDSFSDILAQRLG
ncbi:dihydroxyacetone kinase subunit DhaL [Tropicimonas sp. TH_r6]|uniref:dihydroxyacetone kinase subunit DhaL n=1 Tax=Tropicimonas sp. TH_r6 TaxID=3082085 RepID=UPI00295565B4|nr:dihydroxyacetone kinase subunit DhaL [Tropicimonas sp. TH_r6]